MINVDYHIHSYYSDDCNNPMEQIVKDAISMNLDEICFTDHVSLGIKHDWTTNLDTYDFHEKENLPHMNIKYPAYFKEIESLNNKYKNDIKILRGMEYGMQRHTIDLFRDLYKKYPLDFIILSCHEIENKELWLQQYQEGKTQIEYNRGYYNEILTIIKQFKNYSVLGHLDMIVRYDKQGKCPFEYVEDIVREILKIVVEDNRGIEINTSCYRYKLGDLTPSKKILEIYKELGGKILTIGSDAHRQEAFLNSHIKETLPILKDMGFEYICTYRNMVPIFNKI